MQTVYLKEHEGFLQNSLGPLSVSSVPWWSGLGSPSSYGTEPYAQLKPSSMDHPGLGGQLKATKSDQGLEKERTTKFTIFPGNCKSSSKGEKSLELQMANSMRSALPEYQGRFELGFGQSMICAKHPYGDQYFGVLSTYGPQGRIMLPLNLTTDDGPIYVNAKQYHGILRRRKSRAKAELENKMLKGRKPYLHLSRHLHAMRRPRGCGGRFLNTKKPNGSKGGTETSKTRDGQIPQPTDSQSSEVLQSDCGNLNSPKGANSSRLNLSVSEVTSMYSMEALTRFSISHLPPSVHSLSGMMNTGQHSIGVPGKWAAAAAVADRCCFNLKV